MLTAAPPRRAAGGAPRQRARIGGFVWRHPARFKNVQRGPCPGFVYKVPGDGPRRWHSPMSDCRHTQTHAHAHVLSAPHTHNTRARADLGLKTAPPILLSRARRCCAPLPPTAVRLVRTTRPYPGLPFSFSILSYWPRKLTWPWQMRWLATPYTATARTCVLTSRTLRSSHWRTAPRQQGAAHSVTPPVPPWGGATLWRPTGDRRRQHTSSRPLHVASALLRRRSRPRP